MGPPTPQDPLAGPQLESKCKKYTFDAHVCLVQTLTENAVKEYCRCRKMPKYFSAQCNRIANRVTRRGNTRHPTKQPVTKIGKCKSRGRAGVQTEIVEIIDAKY